MDLNDIRRDLQHEAGHHAVALVVTNGSEDVIIDGISVGGGGANASWGLAGVDLTRMPYEDRIVVLLAGVFCENQWWRQGPDCLERQVAWLDANQGAPTCSSDMMRVKSETATVQGISMKRQGWQKKINLPDVLRPALVRLHEFGDVVWASVGELAKETETSGSLHLNRDGVLAILRKNLIPAARTRSAFR